MWEDFRVARYRFVLLAGERGLSLPPYKGSTFRGGFGSAFRRIACAQAHKKECHDCILHPSCPYAYIFETAPPQGSLALSQYEDVPRPFVLEPPEEEKNLYYPGEELDLGLVLVGRAIDYLPYFIVAFRELGEAGLGRGRNPFILKRVLAVEPLTRREEEIYSGEGLVRSLDASLSGDHVARAVEDWPGEEVKISYLTMTRLKFNRQLVEQVDFHILARALLRRVSSLYYFHHGRQWEADFKGLISRAQEVERRRDSTHWVDWERYSSRQETRMSLGGVVGDVTYHGPVGDFLPLLKLGELVHVGKACTFGMGRYSLAPGGEEET